MLERPRRGGWGSQTSRLGRVACRGCRAMDKPCNPDEVKLHTAPANCGRSRRCLARPRCYTCRGSFCCYAAAFVAAACGLAVVVRLVGTAGWQAAATTGIPLLHRTRDALGTTEAASPQGAPLSVAMLSLEDPVLASRIKSPTREDHLSIEVTRVRRTLSLAPQAKLPKHTQDWLRSAGSASAA